MPNAAKRLLTKRTQFSSDTADPRFVFSLSTLSFLFPRWPVIASNTRQSQKIQTKSSIYTLQPNFSLRVLAQGLFKSLSDPLTSHTRTMSPVPSWACTRSIKPPPMSWHISPASNQTEGGRRYFCFVLRPLILPLLPACVLSTPLHLPSSCVAVSCAQISFVPTLLLTIHSSLTAYWISRVALVLTLQPSYCSLSHTHCATVDPLYFFSFLRYRSVC